MFSLLLKSGLLVAKDYLLNRTENMNTKRVILGYILLIYFIY